MKINRHHLKSPIEVITTQLGIPLDYKQQCIDEVYKIGDKQNLQTNVKAIMSSYHIWEETQVLNPILDRIVNITNNLYASPPKPYEYHPVHFWSATYKQGHTALSHQHSPAIFSFVYYLKSSSTSSPLIFDHLDFSIQPKDDLLVIFPSYAYHSVPPHEDKEDRICLAGNLEMDLKQQK